MGQAMAETVGYVNRARAFMPPGTVPPFVMRFDAGSVPVAPGVLQPNRTPGRDAGHRAQPRAAAVRHAARRLGAAAVRRQPADHRRPVNPERLRAVPHLAGRSDPRGEPRQHRLPSGNVRIGDLIRIARPTRPSAPTSQELLDAPDAPGRRSDRLPARHRHHRRRHRHHHRLRPRQRPAHGLHPVTKRADASTLAVIQRVKAALPRMREVAARRGRATSISSSTSRATWSTPSRAWSRRGCWARC